jgi:hypothetical protein
MWLQMSRAVCTRCGEKKRQPILRCQRCGFMPHTDSDKAKAIILSLFYQREEEYLGKTEKELTQIAADITSGKPYQFDETEVNRVIKYARMVEAISTKRILIDGIRWIFPPIGLLVAIWLIIYFAM